MKVYDLTVQDARRMLGKNASNRVAVALLGVLQSMSEVYPDTKDIPEHVLRDELIPAAEERA